jgi:hypothetical protein
MGRVALGQALAEGGTRADALERVGCYRHARIGRQEGVDVREREAMSVENEGMHGEGLS